MMTKAQLKLIISEMDAKGLSDSAEIRVLMVAGGSIEINQNSFKVQLADSDYTLDASDHFAPTQNQGEAGFLKQV